MTPQTLDIFFLSGIGVCAAGAILNLFLLTRRGLQALFMSMAFLDLGATIELYRVAAPQFLVWLGAAVLVLLLILEATFKASTARTHK